MAIKKGDIIKVNYEGTLEDGNVFDSTERNGGAPLKFEVGGGQLIPGFDEGVVGKEVGQEITINIPPENAYGPRNDQFFRKIPRSQLPERGTPELGKKLVLVDPQGRQTMAIISEVGEEEVTLDLNHPLTGKTLKFNIRILETGCEPDPPQACGCGCGHDH